MLAYERAAWKQGACRVAGVDEAGRGPWAGPLVVVAACIDPSYLEREAKASLSGLTDSKKLSAKQREAFYTLLTTAPQVAYATVCIGSVQIDTWNILGATHRGMRMALEQLHPSPDYALIDGLPVPDIPCPARSLVRGDGLSLSIAAASVIAKVTRDRLMVELDGQHPGYGFTRHKGYGTPEHRAALARLGVSPVHRRSFQPVRERLDPPWFA